MGRVVRCSFLLSILVFSFSSRLSYAGETDSAAAMQEVMAEVKALRQQVAQLNAEVVALKQDKAQPQTQQTSQSSQSVTTPKKSPQAMPVAQQTEQALQSAAPKQDMTPKTNTAAGKSRSKKNAKTDFAPYAKPIAYLGGTAVLTSPYLGVRSKFDGADLIVNIPDVHEDLRLLQQWQKLEEALHAQGQKLPDHPVIELSGKVEGAGAVSWPAQGKTKFNIDLAAAEIDMLAQVNPWAVGFISIIYENTPPETTQQRIENARLTLDKGFVTLGNLNEFPVYFTAGQITVPFGRDTSAMLTSTLPSVIGETRARVFQLGFQQPNTQRGFSAQGYIFKGDTLVSNRLQGGINADYFFDYETHDIGISGEAGVSLISSITESDGMQQTGGEGFTGFGVPGTGLQHRVPALDFYANVSVGHFDYIFEYVYPVRPFSPEDMTFNGHGARPTALQLEAGYSFSGIRDVPTSISVAYGNTSQALALNLPQNQFLAALNMAIWKDTIETLEYRFDKNYSSSSTASGAEIAIPQSGIPGGTSHTLSAQIALYF